MLVKIIAVICVFSVAIGQVLFKLSANFFQQTGSFFSPKPAITLVVALALYGITTIVWIWVLQKVELGKVYPLMALAFVLVPLGSYWFLGERFQPQYFFGVTLIVIGIIIAVGS
jgi:drug/metabolite transporter (DMT)-like permease